MAHEKDKKYGEYVISSEPISGQFLDRILGV